MKYFYLELFGHIDFFKVDEAQNKCWRLRTQAKPGGCRYHVKGLYEISYKSFYGTYIAFQSKFKKAEFREIQKEEFDFEVLNYVRQVTK